MPRAALTTRRGQANVVPLLGEGAPGLLLRCGSALFWDPVYRDWTAVAMGAFDKPTGTHLELHIFSAHKGDYYEIADGLPENLQ